MPGSSEKIKRSRYSVLISASHKDRDLARDLARRLKKVGVHSSYSELGLSAGSSYEKVFMNLLREADEIVLILSSNSVEDFWMMFGIGAACSLRKRITPVIVGLDKQEVPSLIKQLKYITYDNLSDYIFNLERLAQAA